MSKPSSSIQPLLKLLSSDAHLFAECPSCSESFSLSQSSLFYGEDFSPAALEFITAKNTEITDAKAKLQKMIEKATVGAAKKSTEVNFGKVLEKVAPALEGFPFNKTDCRPIFEPIDYLVFKGWSENSKVEELCFVDIKTGDARLSPRQVQIKQVIEQGKVELQVY